MSLAALLNSAESSSREIFAAEWDRLDAILERADAPQPKDGGELLDLAAKLNIPREQLPALVELARRRQQLQQDVCALTAQAARAATDAAKVAEMLEGHQLAMRQLKVDRERVLLDLPAEIRQLREVARVARALSDIHGTNGRDAFLASRGYASIFVNGQPFLTNYRSPAGHVLGVYTALAHEAAAALEKVGATIGDDVQLAADLAKIDAAFGASNEQTEAPPATA